MSLVHPVWSDANAGVEEGDICAGSYRMRR